MPNVTKRCSRCCAIKPLEDFHRHANGPMGRASWCKPCWNAYYRERRKDPKEALRHRRRVRSGHLRRRYGLTLDEYEQLLIAQSGRCALCLDPIMPAAWLAVDHCHAAGEVRGLLCSPCNRLLHSMEHDIDWFQRAVEYLLS